MARYFLIAGETSGDHLGAQLIAALRARDAAAQFYGVGGAEMSRAGLASLFPVSEIAVMGILPVLPRLPMILARLRETARAAVAAAPDCVVLIDAPDFTHRVARRIRKSAPHIPIIDFVCPSVWAWRPSRAKKMRAYVDHVLALLPFEPAALRELSGPPCDYVGHPLVERIAELTPDADDEPARTAPTLLVMPGSRLAEIKRLAPIYGETIALLARDVPGLEVVVPVAPGMEAALEQALRDWPIAARPLPNPPPLRGRGDSPGASSGARARLRLISSADKFGAFRRARAALVTSGVATLELALAQLPMVVAYRVSPLESPLRHLVRAPFFALPNLILGEAVVPEFLQEAATPENLAAALAPLLGGGAAREAQLAGLSRVRDQVCAAGAAPSARAAEIVVSYARRATESADCA
jgi:lipid-A-disaccharide synthase